MRHLLFSVALALAAVGCSGGGASVPPVRGGDSPAPANAEEFWPSWLSERYSDGAISLRYPGGWIENDTRSFGHVLSDNKSPTAAFVGVRYLPRRTWEDAGEFASVATRTLRPPRGRGTTTLYTQPAKIGGRRGVEAAIMWQVVAFSPLGPTMRVFAIELASGRVAFITFAAEKPTYHSVFFAWIKKSIAWR